MKIVSNSVEETIKIGESFAKTLKGGEIVLLDGDLGAGKTHFSKGVAIGLGITEIVTSPTFTLHNVYQGSVYRLNHFDFYRVEDEDEAQQLGLDEIFYDANSISLIEWWQNIKGLLPDKTRRVSINSINITQREISIDE